MSKAIHSLRLLAAPATAALLMGTLFVLEERHFDRNSALLLMLLTGVAVAEQELAPQIAQVKEIRRSADANAAALGVTAPK